MFTLSWTKNSITKLLFFSIFVTITCINYITCQLNEGDACFNRRYKAQGACKVLEHCEKVLDDFVENDLIPQLCRIVNNQNIICCPGAIPTEKQNYGRVQYRDSKTMCAEYAKSVFVLKENPSLGGPPMNVSLCAHKSTTLIVGGEKAKAGEFPHMALIGYDLVLENSVKIIQWGCGGSLISEKWVLTAGHCADTDAFGAAKYIRLGELDFNRTDDQTETQYFTVDDVKKHPAYSFYHYDDIALLKLNRIAVFNKFVRPACLWTELNIKAKRAIATGWGDVEFGGSPSSHLLKVTLDLIWETSCSSFHKPDRRLTTGINNSIQLCGGGVKKDTCQGDSGGPLQIYADEDFYCMYYVVGVTSFGRVCGLSKSPGVFTRVSAYVPWIEKIVWNSDGGSYR